MGDITSDVNNLINAHDDQVEENRWSKDKLVDIEDSLATITLKSGVFQRECHH